MLNNVSMLNSIVSEFSIFAENLQFPFVEGGSGSDTFRRSRRGDMSLLSSCVFKTTMFEKTSFGILICFKNRKVSFLNS